ncbi:MAG: extracellular solute-binding protein [Spirochaetales bacterium]|jgi:putative spermidine/putrescine transport system substrate-binding protein|nr:extracellular solute-binding protein [Spirochaetales bacterium]
MKRVTVIILLAALCVSAVFAGGEKEAAAPAADLSKLSTEQLAAGAKAEGKIESVAMPDDWADWATSWKAIEKKYGIQHFDTDMGSAEEVAIFEAEKDSPTKDIGDVGHSFGLVAIERDVVQPYKAKTWASIPDWAKDPQGRWALSYTGTIAFAVNTNKTNGAVPKTWAELKASNYSVTLGNVLSSSSPQVAVISCAIAYGGGLTNVRPGIEYFKDLAKQKRIDPGSNSRTRLASGEITVLAGRYDLSGLLYRELIVSTGTGPKIEVTIPQDGAITSGYALIFNKYSPHPHATALAIEYMFSDEGQIDRARGFARPIRPDVKLPADVAAKMLPDALYAKATLVKDPIALQKAQAEVARLWEEEVVPLIK